MAMLVEQVTPGTDNECRNPTDDQEDNEFCNPTDDCDQKKGSRALEMNKMLKTSDLMNLYPIERRQIDEFCNDIGLSYEQKIQITRLMKAIRSNEPQQTTNCDHIKASERQHSKACDRCTLLNPSTATQCAMCDNPFTNKHNGIPTTQTFTPSSQNETAGSLQLDPQFEDILKENHLYDDLHKILSDNQCEMAHLQMLRKDEVDDFCKQMGLSLVHQKLKFRTLIMKIKQLHDTVDQSTPTSDEAKQSDEDIRYAQKQAKKKAEKLHRAETLKSLIDDKMTVILIGDTHAGKTSLFHNFIGDQFEHKRSSTIGIDSTMTVETLRGQRGTNMEVHVIDTAGQERWRTASQGYYKKADCVFVCFSVVNENNNDLWYWRERIEEYARDDVIVMFVGCKSDLIPTNREVHQMNQGLVENQMKMKQWKKFNPTYFQCSSKTG
eukprot:453954_1